jgi:hydroxymethylpyrimidine pyrophosphatase-like HAD family hydrolase
MKDWIATDLDSTLFSRGWAAEDAVAATWGRAEDSSRTPSSWMKAGTHRLLESLNQSFALVPITARDWPSFARVAVAGLNLRGPAVIANGAVILGWDGKPDAQWEEIMLAKLAPCESSLRDFGAWLTGASAGNARPRLVMGPRERPAYLVAKAGPGWWQSAAGLAVLSRMDRQDFRVEVLGSELQVLPPGVGKRDATLEVQNRWFDGRAPLLCIGDMPLDLEFMRLGGLLATPVGSTLDQAWPP